MGTLIANIARHWTSFIWLWLHPPVILMVVWIGTDFPNLQGALGAFGVAYFFFAFLLAVRPYTRKVATGRETLFAVFAVTTACLVLCIGLTFLLYSVAKAVNLLS